MRVLLLTLLLLGGPGVSSQPTVQGTCSGELLASPSEGVRLLSMCHVSEDQVEVEFVVEAVNRRRTARRLAGISIELGGQLETVTSPPGWEATQRSRNKEGTVIVAWRPAGNATSLRMLGTARGFRVWLRGPNAGVGCTNTLDVGKGGVASGCAS